MTTTFFRALVLLCIPAAIFVPAIKAQGCLYTPQPTRIDCVCQGGGTVEATVLFPTSGHGFAISSGLHYCPNTMCTWFGAEAVICPPPASTLASAKVQQNLEKLSQKYSLLVASCQGGLVEYDSARPRQLGPARPEIRGFVTSASDSITLPKTSELNHASEHRVPIISTKEW